MYRQRIHETRTTCCYCGVGCGLIVESDGARITGVRGDPAHPANFGRLCTKGATLDLTMRSGRRVHYPELRAARGAPRLRVSWEHALEHAARRYADTIAAHGPDSVAFYVSGQLLTEDYYVFNKLAKGLIGTNNIDTNSRLCMSSAVAGYQATLGADAPPAAYEDIDHARCLLIAGANMAYAHPVLFRRIEDAKRARPSLAIVVVDPRRTDTAAAADLHLPIVPGTDIALFNAMLHVLIAEDLIDRAWIAAHTTGFDALARRAGACTPDAAARICGVPARDIVTAARWFGRSGASLSLYCQGLNQSTHGTNNNAALINLHLATGQIGRPGAGPFSLTGQPNAMGGREVGGLANQLVAHRELADPAHRAEVAALWGVDAVPARPGLTAVELFEAMRGGRVRAVWIACTNPAQSMPDARRVREALERCEFVVLQEAYADTETAPYADLLLPATSWAEKEGTVTNSERRISRVRAAVPGPGEARPDWAIATEFARRLGTRTGRAARAARLFPYTRAEQIHAEHRATTRGRDLDITGLSYALLDHAGPQQWPYAAGAASGRTRLYADGVFPTGDGRARFADTAHRAALEQPDARHPLRLLTGRLRDQWHGMSRTGKVARLHAHAPEPLLSMHAEDMRARGLTDGDLARISGVRGAIHLRVAASPELARGQVFLPMHWGSQFLSDAGANALTQPAYDPVSKQPELKHAAVEVEAARLPFELVALRRLEAGADAAEALERAREFLRAAPYATLGLTGREAAVVVLRLRAPRAFDPSLLTRVDAMLGLDGATRTLTYTDATRGVDKRVALAGGHLVAARLAGETRAAQWLAQAMLAQSFDTPAAALAALAPLAAPPPRIAAPRGRIVCNCLDVAECEIAAALAGGGDLAQLQRQLGCGTECGSCLPELRRLVAGVATGGERVA
jgi:assimilatory nitrate reductase catalytic subunit